MHIKHFLEKKNGGGKPKKKKKYKCTPSFGLHSGHFKVRRDEVLISKIGWVKISELGKIPENDKYYNPRVSFDNKYWYISVAIDIEPKKYKLTNEIIGIDVGIKELAVLSNGDMYENINKKSKEIKRLEKKKKRIQRGISRKYIMNNKPKEYHKTENIKKDEQKIRLIERKLRMKRDSYLQEVSLKIVSLNPKKIVLEDLNIKGMMKNRHLAKALKEQKLNKFMQLIEDKSSYRGIEIQEVDRFYPSSKTCSNCGNIKKDLKLKDRTYKCPNCGLEIDRDLNAAKNLAMQG